MVEFFSVTLLLFFLVGMGFLFRFRLASSPYLTLMYLSFLFFFLLIPSLNLHFFEYSRGVRELVDNHIIYSLYLYVVGSALLTFFLYILVMKKPSQRFQAVDNRGSSESIFALILCGLSLLGSYLVYLGMGMPLEKLLNASRFEWFKGEDFNPVLLNAGFYLSVLGIVPVAYYFSRQQSYLAYKAMLLANYLFLSVITSGRKWLLAYGTGVIVGWLLKGRGVRGYSFKVVLTISILVVAVVMLQVGRRYSIDEMFQGVVSTLSASSLDLLEKGDISYFYRASLDALRLHVEEGVMYVLHPVRTLLFIFVPNEFTLGMKLESIEFLFSNALGIDGVYRNANQPPGFLGYIVLAFGVPFAGVLAALFIISFGRWLDKLYWQKNSILALSLQATSIYCWVLMLRGSSSSLYHFVFNSMVVFLMVYTIKCFSNNLIEEE